MTKFEASVPLSQSLIHSYKLQIATHTREVQRHTDEILRLNDLIKQHQSNIAKQRLREGHYEASIFKGHE